MENYEEKYKEALERCKSWMKGEHPECFTEAQKAGEFIFPELRESEDERIRKDIIAFLKADKPFADNETLGNWITWLEKQDEQKPDDKVEPKFNVGNWIVTPDNETKQIEKVTFGNYWFTDKTLYNIIDVDNKGHLWTIQDAKDGDVLVYEGEIFMIKSYVLWHKILYHCCYDGKNLHKHSIYDSWRKEDFDKVHPATKEQREFLFRKMHEEEYEWDAEKVITWIALHAELYGGFNQGKLNSMCEDLRKSMEE
jgi:hypothetical protein